MVDLRNGATTASRVRVGLRVAPQLAAVRVVGQAAATDRTGFEARRRTGQRRYMTAEEIRRRQPTTFTQLVVGQLGFTVTPNRPNDPSGRVGGYTVRSGRGIGSLNVGCPVQYFVDGTPVPVLRDGSRLIDTIDDVVNPTTIRGIEFYAGGGPVPPEYRLGSRAACGTIVIWTAATDR